MEHQTATLRRHLWHVISAMCLALAALVVAPAAAQAFADQSANVVTCNGSAEQTYDPGLTTVTRDTRIVSVLTFDSCLDPETPPVTSALITVDYTTPASCLVSPPITMTDLEIDWSDDQHSTAEVTVVVTRTTGSTIVASTGTVTSGLFAGYRFSDQVTYPSLSLLDCLLGTGVTHLEGVAALAITPA